MAIWEKLFSKITFKDYPDTSTPLNADNLNKMTDAIDGIDDRVVELNSNLNELDNNIGHLKHLTIYRTATKTFSFRLKPESGTRHSFLMFGAVNAIPILSSVMISTASMTTAHTTNPYGDSDVISSIECTTLDDDGYTTITITFTANIYGRIEILSKYSMIDNV